MNSKSKFIGMANRNNVGIDNRVPDRPQSLSIAEMANNHLSRVMDRIELDNPDRDDVDPQVYIYLSRICFELYSCLL